MHKLSNRDENISRFIANLADLDAGERARFKRNAGNKIPEAHNALGLFYRTALRDVHIPEYREETFFLVATLFAFEKPAKDKSARPKKLPFAQAMRQIRTVHAKQSGGEKQTKGLDKRMERLLDADRQQLPYYLRREVQFLANEGRHIDWEQLLKDLLQWENPERFVQRRWAREYFGSGWKTDDTAAVPYPDA